MVFIRVNSITNDEAIIILRKEGCSDTIIRHCITVSKVSTILAIALKKKGINLDIDIVRVGALLHDVGRSKTHSVSHGYIGGIILKKKHINEKIIRIVERHVGGGITKEEAIRMNFPKNQYVPETLEEKIVCFADKIVGVDTLVSLDKTLNQLKIKLGEENNAIIKIIELKEEITALLGNEPEYVVGPFLK